MIEKLERLLEEYVGKHVSITEAMDLRRDLGLNSLELVELVVQLEDTFDIEISDREVMGLTTVGDVIDAIKAKQSAK